MKSTRVFLLPLIVALCTQCRLNISDERLEAASKTLGDTISVDSFNFQRDSDSTLKGWTGIQDNGEFIPLPPGWEVRVADRKLYQEAVASPPNSADSIECVTFARWENDAPSSHNYAFARQLANNAFSPFHVTSDTLKKLVFQHDFGVERIAGFLAQKKAYKGYCLAYVNDSCTYRFCIILSEDRLKNYQGKLVADIVGNIQINHKDFLMNDNPLKQIIRLH
ncbi:hypothetical protein [Hymenobacter siberiensis]|jgi:hypothetical protein|uniref:hypothetical protein n=1 Tax=Hymenobacter siberiensis TaxID=2848396 RepID=UPI001C1E35DD|nr:hypothetical protein [Hymenobacter siberiensis]MBU6120662.1 hypothetical protein [Hymenobacter siberiensis]